MPRDLKKDLELCNKATKGPWYTGGIDGVPNRLIATTSFYGGGKIYTRGQEANPGADAEFIAAARDGWPEAIKRSIEAEAKILELENRIDVLSTVVNMYCSPYYDMEDRADEAETALKEACVVLADITGSCPYDRWDWCCNYNNCNNDTEECFAKYFSKMAREKRCSKY